MTTSSLPYPGRPEETGSATTAEAVPLPDADVLFWELVDFVEGSLTQN